MRRVIALLPLPLLIATAPPPPAVDVGRGCLNHSVTPAAARPAAGFRWLNQLPPANEILTVIHAEDGCMKPVIVRYGIGGNPNAR